MTTTRDKQFNVRLSASELEQLRRLAEDMGVCGASWVRIKIREATREAEKATGGT